jgi:hypothetical protein
MYHIIHELTILFIVQHIFVFVEQVNIHGQTDSFNLALTNKQLRVACDLSVADPCPSE